MIILVLDQSERLAPEPYGIQEHTVKCRAKQIPALGKQGIQSARAENQTGFFALEAKTHPGGLPGYVQLFHKPGEIGVGFGVKHNKTRIYGISLAVNCDINRIRMAADMIICFKNRYLMVRAQ